MQRQTLLLIDENPVAMTLTKRILERAGYFVRCADSLTDARALLMEFTPDGIVLEIELSDGNGLEYCRELRKIGSLPVMLFSGDREDELPALQAGASDFIKIPCNYDVMKARINIMLMKSRVRDSKEYVNSKEDK